MKPLVNIIIVNWNGKELLFGCMEGLRSQVFKSFCITMVDNGSTDGSVDYIKKNYPEVDLIALNENTGFSVANNIAIKKAKTKYIALLNNDTQAHPLWLKSFIKAMEAHPEAGFAACKMLYHRNPKTIDRAGDIYTTAGTALLRGRSKSSNYFKVQDFVFGACAGAAIYRTEMFGDIGLFDEDFFLLYEDVDLSFRAQLHGYKCIYVPEAIVYHKVGSSIGHDSSLSIYYTHRNMVWTYIKCMPLDLIYKTIFQHIAYCLGCLLFFTFIGKPLPFIKAKYHALKQLNRFLKKRANIQRKKKVNSRYIWELFKNESFLHRIFRRFKKVPSKNTAHILIDFTQIPLQKVGVGVYATNLIEEIIKVPTNNKYFILINDDEDCLDSLEKTNIELIRVKGNYFRRPFLRLFLEQMFIPYLTFKKNIDIIHSLHYSFPLLPLKAKKCVTIHDMSFFKFPKMHKLFKRIYFKFYLKILPEKADRIIAISQSTFEDFISLTGASKRKMSIVPLGRPKWEDAIFPTERIREALSGFGVKNEYLLYIGMIEPRKNITTIIYAFNKIQQSHTDLQLVIAGPKGWHYKPVFKLLDNLKLHGKILFPGYITIDEKAMLMKNAIIFVYPSIYEGFGLPILEAMSLGIPTVTSNVSSMPEIAGDAAVLINPESIDELYSGIKKLLENKQFYNELKEKAILRASQFSWEKAAKETVAVYENILNNE